MNSTIKKKTKVLLAFLLNLYNHIDEKKIIESCQWIQELSSKYILLIRFFPFIPIHIFAQKPIDVIKKYTSLGTLEYLEIRRMWIEYFNIANDDTRMFMTKLFYFTGIYDDEISEAIIKFANTTEKPAYRYWTTMDTSKFSFMLQKGYYSNFYSDRKELLRQIAVESIGSVEPKYIHNINSPDRLCIITYLLDPDMHNSMQRVATMVANGLAKHFSEILVVSLESFVPERNEKIKINTCFRRAASSLNLAAIEGLFDKKIKVIYAEGDSYPVKLKDALKKIYNFSPYCILDISDEYSSISYYYSKKIPTYYLSMRGGGSSSFFNSIFVSNNPSATYDAELIKWIFPEYIPESNDAISRQKIGVSENAFVIMTIGNNKTVCTDDFIDEICQVVDENKKLVWMFVGDDAPDYLHSHYWKLIQEHRIIEWGYEKDLAALCKSCDIVLRANTKGGSGATAIAIQQGLPVAMTNFRCDPMRWLGIDYSSISTYRELAQEVVKLAFDHDYYVAESRRAQDKIKNVLDHNKAWDDLSNILKRPRRPQGV